MIDDAEISETNEQLKPSFSCGEDSITRASRGVHPDQGNCRADTLLRDFVIRQNDIMKRSLIPK